VAGAASDDAGTADIDASRSAAASTSALVNSSTKAPPRRALDDLADNIRRQCPEIAGEGMHERRPFIAAEPVQRDHCHMRLADPDRLELGPVGGDEQYRQVRDSFDREIEQLARGWIDPMQVLKDHQYRLPPRQRLELPQQRRQCPLLLALRAEVERREALAAGKRQHLGDQREVAGVRPVAEQGLELVQFHVRRVVAGKPCGAFQLADKGVERAVLIVR
jgi:hypothetical protein